MARFGKAADGATVEKPLKVAKAPKAPKAGGGRAVRVRPSGGSFVGLDIGTQTIKAAEVKGSGAGLVVTAIAIANTPPGVIQGGMVSDPKALGQAIKQLFSKNGIRSGRVVSAAAGADSVVVRVIEVPKMTPAELAETMKWEIERHIPFAANDVELSYQTIDDASAIAADASNPNMEVLLAVARREMVALHLDTLGAAGLRPVAIDIEILASGRALIDLSKRGFATKNVVIVNIGASLTEVGIFRSGVLRFPRTIPLAGDNITRAIADGLNLSMEDAEDEKRHNAEILMDLLNTASSSDYGMFDDGGYGGATTLSTPFDQPVNIVPPPVFGATLPIAEAPSLAPENPFAAPPAASMDNPFAAPARPASDDPFAVASSYDPFGTPPAAGGGFDLGPDAGTSAAAALPVQEDPGRRRQRDIFDAILPILGELSMELRRSVDYFRSKYPSDTVDQIILCGGSAAIKNLDQYIQQEMGVPTMVADPFAGLNVTSKQMSTMRREEVAPAFAVAIGLAVRDAVIGS